MPSYTYKITVAAILLPLTAACTSQVPADGIKTNEKTAAADDVHTQLPAPVTSPQERKDTDLAPCPGINGDIRRPAGSNCLGILPEQCGADKLTAYKNKVADAAVRAEVGKIVGHDEIRWINPGDAVIQDLRPDRLNMELDDQGRIEKSDCY